MKKVLITGSEGFIGKNLINYLFKLKKYKLYGLDKKKLKTKKYYFYRQDLSKLKKNINFDYIVHLAAIKNPHFKDFNVLINENLFKSINFFNNFKNKKTKFIFASSEWVYQTNKNISHFDENFKIEIKNLNFYSLSKFLFEEYIRNNLNFYKSVSILRLGIVTGSKETAVDYLYNAYKNKKKIITVNSLDNARNYISINDLVQNIEKIFSISKSSTLNITGSKKITLKKICSDLSKKFNHYPIIKQKEPKLVSRKS